MWLCLEALAEVVAATALLDETEIPCTDGQFVLAVFFQKRHQLTDQLRKDLANERELLVHGARQYPRSLRPRTALFDRPVQTGEGHNRRSPTSAILEAASLGDEFGGQGGAATGVLDEQIPARAVRSFAQVVGRTREPGTWVVRP
jgi:hypothetical protein